MDSINTERSYTEYEVTTPTTDFAIGFDNYSGEDKDAIHVTLDGVSLDDLNYTVVRKNAQTIEVTPAIESGVVRLQRETYIDQAFHTFTAGALFSPKSVDENFAQVRRSQQEVHDGFTFLAENTSGVVQASKEATAQAKAATVEATASAVRAGSAADTAVQAVDSLQGVVDAATTATTNANSATDTATTAASQATDATTSAQHAAQAANTAKQEATTAAANASAATTDTLEVIDRANAAAELAENIDVVQFQEQLDEQSLDTGITVTAKEGGVARTQAEKNSDTISVKDIGAVGDGVTNDTPAFTKLELVRSNVSIDLQGLTYNVTTVPTGNLYHNGYFTVGTATYSSTHNIPVANNVFTPMSAYRKRVKANLPYHSSRYTSALALQADSGGGSKALYPQGFCVDWDSRELFILRRGTYTWFEVYDWDTLAFKTSFFTKTADGEYTVSSSEQPTILKVGTRRKLYTKGKTRHIVRFDITTLPDNLGSVTEDASWDVNVLTSFAYSNGTWLVEDASYAYGVSDYRKTRYIRYDGSFNRIGEMEVGAHIAGLDDVLTPMSSQVTKKQGMCIALGGIFFGVGGRRYGASDVNDYRHQGVRFLNGSGDVLLDSTVKHLHALNILKANGVLCEYIESEGVQVLPDNSIYGIYSCLDDSSAGDKTQGGILILEEFSNAPDAIDFSSAAALNTFHNTRLMSGLAAISTDRKLYNPITGAAFTDLQEVCEYMRDCDRELYTFWSSFVPSLKMPDGSDIPTGLRVTIMNTNGNTFFIRGVGVYQDRLWRMVRSSAGVYLTFEFSPRPYRNLLPATDNLSLGQNGTTWSAVHVDAVHNGGVRYITGLGSPEGVVFAEVGSIYTNTSGGAGTTLYIKETGSASTTGWAAK